MDDASRGQRMGGEFSLLRWMKAHDLLTFFVLTFLISFGAWLLVQLSLPDGTAQSMTLVGLLLEFVGLWGPGLAAILTAALTRGKQGLRELFRGFRLWRVPARWYLVILLGWPAIAILGSVLHAQLTNQLLVLHWDSWSQLLGWLIQAPLLGFWACEEIGWRGFALPRLLKRWNALVSSLILGTIWGFWHLPYFAGFQGISMGYPFHSMLVETVAVSILMTWVFNHTQGSLFVATFFHFWFNVYGGFQVEKLPLANPAGESMLTNWLLAVAAVLVVAVYGYRTLTRERKSAAVDSPLRSASG